MAGLVNIYCDESCHLENDRQQAMVLGAVHMPESRKKEVSTRISEIKRRHGMSSDFEIKWTKVSPSKLQMYLDIVDYFFDDDHLKFRCIVAPNKPALDHKKFNQDHDDWYYKMYYQLISFLMKPKNTYKIYLDIKDTRSKEKVRTLHDVLCGSKLDFSRNMIKNVQQVRSHEVVHVQIADLLIGAMSYKARGLDTSTAKTKIVDRISERSGYKLSKSTLYNEEKFNIFIWQAS